MALAGQSRQVPGRGSGVSEGGWADRQKRKLHFVAGAQRAARGESLRVSLAGEAAPRRPPGALLPMRGGWKAGWCYIVCLHSLHRKPEDCIMIACVKLGILLTFLFSSLKLWVAAAEAV